MYPFLLYLSFVVPVFPGPLPAASVDTLPVYQLMGVLVTAPRTSIPLRENPGATAVVRIEEMREMPRGVAVDEAIRMVPGVKVDNQADGERVHMSIRGQGILSEHGLRGIKVLQDGIPLNDPTGFAPDLYDVDWSNVQRIEVLRGPGASLYGGGSTAGVLNIITTPAGTGPAMVAEARTGSNGFWKTNARSAGRVGDVGYQVSASRAMGDGYREHTAFAATNLYAKADVRVSERLEVRPIVAWTGFFNENAEGLNLTWLAEDRTQANPDALIYNELQRTERFTGGFTGEYEVADRTSVDFNAYLRSTRYREPVPSSVQHRSLVGPGATVQLTQRFTTGGVEHAFSAGTDIQWQTIDEYRHPNLGAAEEGPDLLSDQTIAQRGLGVFLLDRIDFSGGWGATLNVRFDRITNELTDHLLAGGVDLSGDADFDRTTARVGVSYSPTEVFSVYANWGQGFLPPATEELASNPAAQGGFNASLTPALSYGEELGARGLVGARLFYDISVFHLDTSGDFDRYRIDTRPLETFYRNGGRSRRFGTEAYVNWSPAARVRAEAAYTWSHFIYRSSTSVYGNIEGNWLPNSPEHQLMTELTVDVLPAVTLGAGTDSYSRWYVDASNATSVDGYTLLNAEATWRLPVRGLDWRLTAQARNLTGTKYIAFTEPDPDGNSYQPGPERELFVGVRAMIP